MKRKSEIKLKNSPSDSISSIKFHKTFHQLLLVSSWDCAVRLYDVASNCLKCKWMTNDAVLDCSYLGPTHVAYGGIDGILNTRDANSNIEETVGCHGDTIKSIEYVQKRNVIVSGSWDRTIKIWDLRQRGSVATYEQCDGRVYSMSVVDEKIAVAASECKALIWDMRNMKKYLILHRLNHHLNCIAISPNKQCYVLGHRDGRVAVEYINKDPEIRKFRARFKCHRMHLNYFEYVYNVGAISFLYANNIFATGGDNGFVNIWDGINKKRLCQYPRYDQSVVSLAFDHHENKLAIACSDRNVNNLPSAPTSITVRYVNK